jgi:hypothetical protein
MRVISGRHVHECWSCKKSFLVEKTYYSNILLERTPPPLLIGGNLSGDIMSNAANLDCGNLSKIYDDDSSCCSYCEFLLRALVLS